MYQIYIQSVPDSVVLSMLCVEVEDVCGGGDCPWCRGRCVRRWRLAMVERMMYMEVETGHGEEDVCGGGDWSWWTGGCVWRWRLAMVERRMRCEAWEDC